MKSLLLLVSLTLLVSAVLAKELPGDGQAARKSPDQRSLDPNRLPINVAVIEGSDVTLQCAVTTDPHNVIWTEYAYSSQGSPISSNLNVGQHPEAARYSIVHGDPMEYSLKISSVIMSDAGYYECMEALTSPIDKRLHSLSLTVLAAEPNCTTTISASGIVFEDSYQTNDCQLEYRGQIIPNMTWFGPGTFTQKYIATNTHIWAGMEFFATRSMDGLAFQVITNFTDYFLPVPGNTANNPPDYTRTDQARQMFVQWGPKNLVIVPIQPRYDVGDILTCSADANPPSEFFWQNLRTNQVIQGHELTLLQEWQGTSQTMRCDARNVIDGVIYSSNVFQPVTINPAATIPTTTPSTTTTVAPAVSDCKDLTGGWESTSPASGSICIRLDLEQNGALRGLLRNESDTYWVDIIGRAQATKFDQVGFNGIWPADIGVSSFIGECHRCHGVEQLLVNVVSRTKGSTCGTGGALRYTAQYTFYRSPTLPCPNLPTQSS